MQLFIANTTKQHHMFSYRVPESASLRTQPIPMGSQIRVSGELSPEQVDYIIKQHVPYGLIAAEDIDRSREFVGLCYSVDKPIAAQRIAYVLTQNTEVLVERGKVIRQEGAVADTLNLENELLTQGRVESLRVLETSVVQESSRDNRSPDFQEGLRVDRNAAPAASQRSGRGGRKGR